MLRQVLQLETTMQSRARRRELRVSRVTGLRYREDVLRPM